MKSTLSFLVLLAAITTVQAQQFSIGLRSGASYLMAKENTGSMLKAVNGQTQTWENVLFFRVTGKRLAFETNFSHYSFNTNRSYYIVCDWGEDVPKYNQAIENIRKDYVEWSLGMQYALSVRKDQRFRHFAGLAVIPGRTYTTMKTLYFNDWTGASEHVTYKSAYWNIWAGINYTATYKVTKSLFLTSELSYKVDAVALRENFYPAGFDRPNNRLGINVGVGYTL